MAEKNLEEEMLVYNEDKYNLLKQCYDRRRKK